jgi:SAM-dependent methyltransferase
MADDTEYDVPVDPDADNNAHSAAIRLVGSNQRVLEVGCWSGHVTRHLADRGNQVVGVELDAEAARRAEAFADRVHVADIDRTPLSQLESGPFDVILFGDVLEHLHDPRRVLEDSVGLLAPDGRFVISIPNVSHIDARMMLLQGNWEYQPDGLLDRTHLRWFTRQSLRELLADVGFVATHLERVRTPFGSSNLPFQREAVSPQLIGYAATDPEAFTLQFVVEARRTGEDQLTDPPMPSWPQLGDASDADAHVADLQRECDALRAEVEAWHNSKLVRVTRPMRSLYARALRRLAR